MISFLYKKGGRTIFTISVEYVTHFLDFKVHLWYRHVCLSKHLEGDCWL